MIVDVNELDDGADISADVVIIGGGLAGITLAREWAGLGKTVAILESGGREIDEATQELYAGTGVMAGDGGAERNIDSYLISSRARAYGGSGHWWGGKCVPLDAADFAPRPWIKDSGWPITRAGLQPYYDRACDMLELERFDKDYDRPQIDGRPPLDFKGRASFASLPREHTPVTGRSDTDHFETFCYDFADAPNISVYLHANVVDINMSADGARLDGLGVATLAGKRYAARGQVYVLACGGIENARLLLAANARNGAAFGARSDALGRHFQGHTVVFKRRSDDEAGPGTRIHFTDPPASLSLYTDRGLEGVHTVLGTTLAGQDAYDCTAFTVTMGSDEASADGAEGAISMTAARIDQADAAADGGAGCWCYFMTENLPNPNSRVTLGDEVDALGMRRSRLRWEYGAQDLDGMMRGVDALARELGAAGLGRVASSVERDEIIELMSPSRHHMGTTRMHADPAVGVVDPNLQCHDADNLYIAGSSVFPTSGIANPTLTILALTIRLSDHLKTKLGA